MSEIEKLESKINGYKGRIKQLEIALEEGGDPTKLKQKIIHLERLIEEYDGCDFIKSIERYRSELGHQASKNAELMEENSKLRQDVMYKRKGQLDAMAECSTLRKRVKGLVSDLAGLRNANRRLQSEIEELKKRVKKEERPTECELKAAKFLGVPVSRLRGWARAGVGPKPPYEELEAWIPWVESRSRR